MQNARPSITGELVRVRRAPWRVVDLRAYADCQLLTLSGVGETNAGSAKGVLTPFDTVESTEPTFAPTLVRARVWRRACRALLATHGSAAAIRSAACARIAILPHQLEPALALVRGLGTRVLLADDVGLGKTVEACLIAAELRARAAADRILILTPAGIRDQWAAELRERFDLASTIADELTLRRLAASLPIGRNPWSALSLVIASIDYVKRPEILPSVRSCRWDLIVVDEAHHLTPGSDRRTAVAAVASRADYLVLATATPHSGDRNAFEDLCCVGAGASDDSLLVFRRTRNSVQLGVKRRIHRLLVRPSAHEHQMHRLLASFCRAVRADRESANALALSVLHKRAFSSPYALGRTIAKRLVTLEAADSGDAHQLSLPIADRAGELSPEDNEPAWPEALGLSDRTRELTLLGDLVAVARTASRDESKLHALRRLLRRSGEQAIVFTEYRDTLLHLAEFLSALTRPAIIHGGLTREERRSALDAFAGGRTRLLFATDAGSEGLNLHHHCRLVINLELPWNPTRLEQRIGRVDRIGQARTVHAFHLIAAGTGETSVMERLHDRIANARCDISTADPLGSRIEEHIARIVVGATDSAPPGGFGRRPSYRDDGRGPRRIEPALAEEAGRECDRLVVARRLAVSHDDRSLAVLDRRAPAVLISKRPRLKRWLHGKVLLLWQASLEDGHGKLISATLVPLISERCADGESLSELIYRLNDACGPLVGAAAATDIERSGELHRAFIGARLRRARETDGDLPGPIDDLFQAGLFDGRSEHARHAEIAASEDARSESAVRLGLLQQSLSLSTHTRMLLVLTA